MELENLKGIGIKSVKLLNNLGIYSMDDLVRNYPYRFDDMKEDVHSSISQSDGMILGYNLQ